MKISCPNCPAAYELDDSRIPPAGLSIKCPKCKTPFIVHKPKAGETGKTVKGAPVPLPGQPGAKAPAKPSAPKAAPPPAAAAAPAPDPQRGAVPLPGLGAEGAARVPFSDDLDLAFGDDPPMPAPAATPPAATLPTPASTRPARPPPEPGAVPLPGLDGEDDLSRTSLDFKPPARPPSPAPAQGVRTEPALPLPGLDRETPADRGPASDPFADVGAPSDTLQDQTSLASTLSPDFDEPAPAAGAFGDEPAFAAGAFDDHGATQPEPAFDAAPGKAPAFGDEPGFGDEPASVAAPAPQAPSDDDFALRPKARPPPPPPPTAPPPTQQQAMDDIFSVDVPEPPAAPPPPRQSSRPPPAVVDDGGISFDFVEAPHAPGQAGPAPRAPAPGGSGPGSDLLDFVDEGAGAQAAPDAPAAKADKKKRAPPPMIAPSGPGDSSPSGESLALDGEAQPQSDDPRRAEKERKKKEGEERKARDREARERRKAARNDQLGPLLQSVRESLSNPRIAGGLVLGLALLVFVVMGVRARRTPAGFFWTNKYIPSKKAATAAETKVIAKGMDRLGEGSFAGAREAVGLAAQLSATLPDDEDVKAFFVLSTSELKLVYGQVGGDWDQAKKVVEKMKGKLLQHERARGAFALANGDVPRGRLLLAPLGDRANADFESIYLFAQSLILSGEQVRAAQVLDNALKTRDSTKLLLLRGLVARQKNQLPEAAAFFEKALQKSPGNGRSLVELADVKLRQNDTAATAALLDKALQPEVRKSLDATEEARASMLRGRLAAVNHKGADAEAAYERAVALDPNSTEIHETYGEFRLSRRDWEKAARQFDLAIAAGNASASAYAGAARAYLGQNRLLEADKRMNEAVRLDGNSAHFMYLQGRVAEAIGKGEEAFRDYERALQKKPDLTEALVAEGTIFVNRGDKEHAREKLDQALKVADAGRTPLDDEAVGDLALSLGERDKGRESFARALEKDPEDPLAHAGLGKALASLDHLPEARVELDRALAEVNNDASLHYEYGSLLRRMGDAPGALVALQRAVKLDSKDPRFRARLGAVLVERADFEQAEQQLRQAVLMNDRYAEAQFFLARALAGQKKLSEAIDTMKKAVEIEPENPEYYYHLGLIYEQGQQVQDAIESFQRSIDRSPKNADALEHLGQNLVVENRFGDAVTAFKKAADLDPKRPRLWAEVGDSEQQAGDLDGAIRDFQKALAQDPSLTGVWSKLGVAYKDKDCKGCKSKAMDALRRAAQLDPTDATAHHELGYMYKDDGRRREAIAEFRKYLELKPDAGDLSTVQDDIYYLQEESHRAP